MSEIVVEFEDESVDALLRDMNLADILEPKPGKRKSRHIDFLVGGLMDLRLKYLLTNIHRRTFVLRLTQALEIFASILANRSMALTQLFDGIVRSKDGMWITGNC